MEARNNDEIDLTELAVRVIRFLKKNLKLTIAFTVIGGLIGFGVSMTLPKTYQARLTLSSDLLNDHQCREIGQSLNSLVAAKEYQGLASHLNIDEGTARKIRSISFDAKTLVAKKNYLKETGYSGEGLSMDRIYEEKETLNTTLTINLNLADNGSLPEFQKSLIIFFSSSEYFKTKSRQRMEFYSTLIKEIDNEIKSLDSLKSKLMNQNSSKSEMVIVDPSNLSLTKIKLRKERLAYGNALELSSGIQVVDNISAVERSLTMKLTLAGLIGGFILSFVYFYLSLILKKVNSPEA